MTAASETSQKRNASFQVEHVAAKSGLISALETKGIYYSFCTCASKVVWSVVRKERPERKVDQRRGNPPQLAEAIGSLTCTFVKAKRPSYETD